MKNDTITVDLLTLFSLPKGMNNREFRSSYHKKVLDSIKNFCGGDINVRNPNLIPSFSFTGTELAIDAKKYSFSKFRLRYTSLPNDPESIFIGVEFSISASILFHSFIDRLGELILFLDVSRISTTDHLSFSSSDEVVDYCALNDFLKPTDSRYYYMYTRFTNIAVVKWDLLGISQSESRVLIDNLRKIKFDGIQIIDLNDRVLIYCDRPFCSHAEYLEYNSSIFKSIHCIGYGNPVSERKLGKFLLEIHNCPGYTPKGWLDIREDVYNKGEIIKINESSPLSVSRHSIKISLDSIPDSHSERSLWDRNFIGSLGDYDEFISLMLTQYKVIEDRVNSLSTQN